MITRHLSFVCLFESKRSQKGWYNSCMLNKKGNGESLQGQNGQTQIANINQDQKGRCKSVRPSSPRVIWAIYPNLGVKPRGKKQQEKEKSLCNNMTRAEAKTSPSPSSSLQFFPLQFCTSSTARKVCQDVYTRGPTPFALRLANQHEAIPRLVSFVGAAAVFDGERRGYLFAVVADDFGEGPEVFLFVGRDPALDDDVVGVLWIVIIVNGDCAVV